MPASADAFALVVPAYGDSPFLDMCLASLRRQTRPAQVVVATSTPSDFITRIAEAHGAPVAVNPTQAGIASDWNFALRVSGARRVTLAHQDDVYADTFVERTLEAFEAVPEAMLCFTAYDEIDDAGRPTASKISFVKHLIERVILHDATRVSGARLRAYLSFGNPLPCSSVTFDLARAGRFSFSSELKSNLDWETWLDLCRAGATFARAPERLVGRRHNAMTETSKAIASGRRGQEDLHMFRRLWPWPVSDLISLLYRAGY